jgi:hypothetical protein
MFGRKSEKRARVLFLRDCVADGTFFQVGEVEEISGAGAKQLIADGSAEPTEKPLHRFDRQPGCWRQNEQRDWQERRVQMQLPAE